MKNKRFAALVAGFIAQGFGSIAMGAAFPVGKYVGTQSNGSPCSLAITAGEDPGYPSYYLFTVFMGDSSFASAGTSQSEAIAQLQNKNSVVAEREEDLSSIAIEIAFSGGQPSSFRAKTGFVFHNVLQCANLMETSN